MRRSVRIGGVPMSAIAPWGDLTYSSDAYGCREITWGASYSKGFTHAAVHAGALVEVLYGSAVIASGAMVNPDWRGGTFTAMGLAYGAEKFLALDASGNATANPTLAATQAIARNSGNGWNLAGVDTSVPNTAFLSAVDGASTIGALCDSNANELGQWWTVQADRVLRFQSKAITPTWYLRRGLLDLGSAPDDYASTMAVVYLNSATSKYDKILRTDDLIAQRFDYREAPVDATVLGPITATKAAAIGDGILIKNRSMLGWNASLEVTSNDLRTNGGVRADLALVKSHDLVRIPGTFEDLQLLGKPYLDVPIGTAEYADGSGSMTIAPLGSAASSLADIIQEVFEVAAGKKAA